MNPLLYVAQVLNLAKEKRTCPHCRKQLPKDRDRLARCPRCSGSLEGPTWEDENADVWPRPKNGGEE
jgi:predicted amidophosphoribosyltransferase